VKANEVQCPACKSTLEGATFINDEKIEVIAGDLSLCVYCQTILVFNDDQTVREATPDDLASLTAIEQHLLKIMGESFTEFTIDQ